MIYTVTFNPSLDYILNLDEIKIGKTNRSKTEEIYVGGKGINVSIVLKNLGIESKILGFSGGFVGKEIERILSTLGCNCDFIKVDENSRINVKLKALEESEINANGPVIQSDKIEKLYSKLNNLNNGDILILAGSIPNSLPNNIYEKIQENLKNKDIKIIIDATKELLINSLKYSPFLVKPNKDELSEIFNVKLNTQEDIIFYAKKLKENGSKNVIVSLGKNGAIFIDENDNIYTLPAPKGTLINSVGAGDSMIAGFIAGLLKFNNYEDAFKYSVATGSGTAFSKWLANEDIVNKILININ